MTLSVQHEASVAPQIQWRASSSAPVGELPFQIIRRNGTVSRFDAAKISIAMTKAFLAVEGIRAAASRRVHDIVARAHRRKSSPR